MSPAPLLFVGVPGGMEMVVFLVVFFVLFGVPATLLVILGYKHVRESATAPAEEDADRIAALEAEVEELRARLDEEGDAGRDVESNARPNEEGVR